MRQMFVKLWNDDCGALIATEWVFFVTLLIIGIITGLVALRQAVIVELTEVAQAIMSLNQSYSFSGQSNCEAATGGSAAVDTCGSITEGSLTTPSNVCLIKQAACD